MIRSFLPPEFRSRSRPVPAADRRLRRPLRAVVDAEVFRAVLIDCCSAPLSAASLPHSGPERSSS